MNLRWRSLLGWSALVVAAVFLRRVIWALLIQLAAAGLLMLLALPVCKGLERRLSPGISAALSLGVLGAVTAGTLLLLAPPITRQFRQLSDALPRLLLWAQAQWDVMQAFLAERGLSLSIVRDSLFSTLSEQAGTIVSATAGLVTQAVQAASKVLIAPLLAFYLLRDRRLIGDSLTLLIPVRYRTQAVRAAREMRRETTGFLRGQLLLSLAVGMMTAFALLLVGTPGWMLLGVLMGFLELVPYLGPLIAGIPAVLLALQLGVGKALWTVAALLIVQQLESTWLSPRLLSGATRLHPLLVLLALSAGGIIGGALGMVLVIPALVSFRGAARGWRS